MLAQLAVLLWRHTNELVEGVVKAAAGAKSSGECDIQNCFIGIAKQCADVVDTHCGNVLLHGELHYALENPHRIIGIEFYVFRNIVDGECLIVVVSDKAQHLAYVKLGVPGYAVFVCARGFIDQDWLPARKVKPLKHQANFIDGKLADLFVRAAQFLLPALNFKSAQLLCGQ